jgi:hypothetical protein
MLSKADILDCFDTIVTTQAQNREEAILVFFDEINATLQGQHVYDTFLAPLEESIYVRAGKTFHVDPCIWVFAGTERPHKPEEGPQRDKTTKASDFESRLSIPPLNIKFDDKEKDEARIEGVYLGAVLLKSMFPDVRKVSEKVLTVFHNLYPTLETRGLRHFVKSFVDIQYGEIVSKNVPTKWLKEHMEGKIDITSWERAAEGDMVDIIT